MDTFPVNFDDANLKRLNTKSEQCLPGGHGGICLLVWEANHDDVSTGKVDTLKKTFFLKELSENIPDRRKQTLGNQHLQSITAIGQNLEMRKGGEEKKWGQVAHGNLWGSCSR